jgi:hypothetical protein
MSRASIVFLGALLAAALGILLPAAVMAAPCTPGTDCYCDRVKGGDLNDTSLLMCEDFEAPTLYQSTGVGNGAPYYGPWYDDTGFPGNRGNNSYWAQVYGNGASGVIWGDNQPSSPRFGSPCNVGGDCTGMKVWDATNRWNANNLGACAAFLRAGEYTGETALVAPTGANGGGSGSFDGTVSMFHRVPARDTCGILGQKTWPMTRTFGVTMVVAYAPNVISTGPGDDFWKHNEWMFDINSAGGDGLFLFGDGGGQNFPFYQFTFSDGVSQSTCNSRLSAATKAIGDFECDSNGNFLWRAASAQYRQSTHWPFGTWGCARAFYQNLGTSSSTIEMWFTGPDGVERKIIDIRGMNLTGHTVGRGPGIQGYIWVAYANANQGANVTTQTSGRYEDNIHVRAGAPVSCTQIGFAGGGGPGPGIGAPTLRLVK